MNPLMNMNFGLPQPNMNFNQNMYQQFRNMYNNIPQHNMDFNQYMYLQFMNQNRMNIYPQNNYNNDINNNFNLDDRNNRNNFENEYPEEESQNLRTVFFEFSSGDKLSFIVPYYETIAYLFRLFIRKLGIRENALENNIFFLYDAKRLEVDDQRAIYEIFKDNSPKILVFDRSNILLH
jgi:hypothetical protein